MLAHQVRVRVDEKQVVLQGQTKSRQARSNVSAVPSAVNRASTTERSLIWTKVATNDTHHRGVGRLRVANKQIVARTSCTQLWMSSSSRASDQSLWQFRLGSSLPDFQGRDANPDV